MSDTSQPAAPPARIPPAETPGLTGLLTLAVGVVVVAGLYLARDVLIPITLAVILSFLLAPFVTLLHGLRLGRVPAVILAVLVSLGVILALLGLIGTQVAELASEAPRYQTTIEHKVSTIQGATLGRMSAIMQRLGRQMEHARTGQGGGQDGAPAPGSSASASANGPMQVEIHQPSPSPLALAERIVEPILSPLSTLAIVFIVAIFVLLQREDLRDRLIRLFGSRDLHRTTTAMNDAARRLSRYFLTQLGVNAAFGVIIGTGLLAIGVPSAPLWGVLGMLLRFVPYVGAPLAAVLPALLAAAVDPGWSMLIWTAALYFCTEMIMGQVVEPMLYGHSTGLSPFSVVVAATFWTWLWGPIGLILSTPLTLCLVVLGRHVERLEFLDVLLGDRPALTPVQSFYQRMLAGDPDEARDQAEVLLREHSLSSYYDEVALKGLQLAATDSGRGVLTAAQLTRIKSAFHDLIEDLDSHDDRDPGGDETEGDVTAPTRAEQDLPKLPAPRGTAPEASARAPDWQGATPVLCLAGRGPLDDAASAMLAQLLGKHGLGARLAEHDAASRENIARLDLDGIAMVCISYLDMSGTHSHLRYLLRRLRHRLPRASILVGLWPAGADILRDDRLRATLDADVFATSLNEAVEACLTASSGTVPTGALRPAT